MAAHCNRKNPLSRNGTNQRGRYREELDPGFFGIDERSTADLIQFAARFSRHLRYYDETNAQAGDWEPFFTSDISAVLSGLQSSPVESFRTFARSLEAYLADDPARPLADLSAHFKLVFHLPFLLLEEAGRHFRLLPLDHALRTALKGILERDAEEPMRLVLSYYKGAIGLPTPLFDDSALDPTAYNTTLDLLDPRIQLPTSVVGRIASEPRLSDLGLNADFLDGIDPGGWNSFYASVPADTAPYEDSQGSPYDQIYDALHFNLLASALEQLYQAVARMQREAGRQLDASLTSFDGHSPHYGLWLAFLRLFGLNQERMNGLLGQHLDFYYREVLRLCRQSARPDHVNLLFELHKNADDHLMPGGRTHFSAGKDESGKEILYRLDADFVVNQGKVASLKALHRPALSSASGTYETVFAANPPNSSDGLGKELPKDRPYWRAFGPSPAAPHARIGFAVADRRLFMREGSRLVVLFVELTASLPAQFYSTAFRASLTSDEGWHTIADPTKLMVFGAGNLLYFILGLDGDEPPVVPYDASIHQERFDSAEPILKLELNFDGDEALSGKLLGLLKDASFTALHLAVSASDVRDFSLQNEAGVLDVSKPFLPFGPMPEKNAPLILGSSEVFSKPLSSLSLDVEWAAALTTAHFGNPTPAAHQVRVRRLSKGKWESPGAYDTTIFNATGTSQNIPLPVPDETGAVEQSVDNPPFDVRSAGGFLKLELEKGFGHLAYLEDRALSLLNLAGVEGMQQGTFAQMKATVQVQTEKAIVEQARPQFEFLPGATQSTPNPPYTPKINEISLRYSTTFSSPERCFHLHPFGAAKASPSADRFLPQLAFEGELYIGIEKLKPPQRLTLLIQVVDGTANPLKEETSLRWDYLRGDAWTAFDEQDVDDKTHNLTGSGIVGLAMPADADTEHGVLPSGLHWIRLAAENDADALNAILSIDAQAATATFVDQQNDPTRLEEPLPSGLITKPREAHVPVKKVAQPYPSYGGRPVEREDAFAVRASERLRHKDRALTMWDYEHLILQEFPAIYRARCINHTQLVRDQDNVIVADNEVRPGHVLVVAIPYVQPETTIDPLRPYTDRRTIGEIDRFLRERLSPFVELEVQNPKFEEVQVKFKVGFAPDVADVKFYRAELNEAIVRHLSPWAYAEGADVSFGGVWHKSAIIDFIEEQPYVDFVKDVEMYHKADASLDDASWIRVDEEVARATTSRSILVSHPAHMVAEVSGPTC